MLQHPVDKAVIRIYALMVAPQSLPALIARNLERDAELRAQLLQLSHDAVGDDGHALCIQAVHHRREQLEFLLDGMREEVGVDEDGVGRDESGVVLEEKGSGDLWT